MTFSIWIGYDPREAEAFAVCRRSLAVHHPDISVHAIVLDELRDAGLYTRPTSTRDGRLWDDISEAPMSTEFAISRFLVPHLAKGDGWALFADCDVMLRGSLGSLFAVADPRYAVMCVKHNYVPPEGVKMDGQMQTLYARKNWSSVMLFNLGHPGNQRLTVDMINSVPGRELHAFKWLYDYEIGEIGPEYNYLVGHTKLADGIEPKIVHWTAGGPWFPQYRDAEYADEWRSMRRKWLLDSAQPPRRLKVERSAKSNGLVRQTL